MELDQISAPPILSDFIPISEYQSQTPETFIGGAPVLHLYVPKARIVLQNASSEKAFSFLRQSDAIAQPPTNGDSVNGTLNGHEHRDDIVLDDLAITVASDHLYIFDPSRTVGAKLSYPSIGLHALATIRNPASATTAVTGAGGPPETIRAVYMQLNLYDVENSNSDEDVHTADIAIDPSSSSSTSPPSSSSSAPPTTSATSAETLGRHATTSDLSADAAAQALYDAVSACQDGHPDPMSDDEGGMEGLMGAGIGSAGMPGDGGWITSENMAQFVDADGNFTGFPGGAGVVDDDDNVMSLGPGAGTVRPRDAAGDEPERATGVAGDADESRAGEDAKRVRTE